MMNPVPAPRRPEWLKVRWNHNQNFRTVEEMVRGLNLHTVCQEARCPNIFECWGEHRTATFMILGDECTRHCAYCAVGTSKRPAPPDRDEPLHVAEAVTHLGLQHAVITSVDRDDLPDGGAAHFAETIREIRRAARGCRVEVLIPDFNGEWDPLTTVLAARPDVLAHNIETVPRVFPRVRHRGDYHRSIELLRRVAQSSASTPPVVKSGLMVGLGETIEELQFTLADIRESGCSFVTIGQYLRPSSKHAEIERLYSPAEFGTLGEHARRLGFRFVESGPLVRSSYHAHVPFR